MSGIKVRPLTTQDHAQALSILVDAFETDPSWTRVIRSRRVVRPLLTRYYGRCLRELIPMSAADGAWDGGRLAGVALWYPPGRRPGGLPGRVAGLLSRRQRQDRDGWLLEGVAVAAAGRGRGIGSALLRHRLDGCTEPVHLEATTGASARLYSRFGFTADPEQRGGDVRMTRAPTAG